MSFELVQRWLPIRLTLRRAVERLFSPGQASYPGRTRRGSLASRRARREIAALFRLPSADLVIGRRRRYHVAHGEHID